MDSTKRAIKYQLYESKKGFVTFWLVLLVVVTFSFFMNKYTDLIMGVSNFEGISAGNLSIMVANLLPILIYFIVYGYEMYYKQFPLALNFSITRKDFFKSMVVNNIGFAFIFALIQSVLLVLDPIIVKAVGAKPMYDLFMFNIKTDNLVFIILSLFIAFMAFITLWNLIAVLNYKLGPVLWIGFGVIAFISTLFVGFNIFDLVFPGNWLNVRMDIFQFAKLSGAMIVMYIIIYFTLINTDAKNKK